LDKILSEGFLRKNMYIHTAATPIRRENNRIPNITEKGFIYPGAAAT